MNWTDESSRVAVPVRVTPSCARVAVNAPGKPTQLSQYQTSPVDETLLPLKVGSELRVPKM